MNRPFIYKTRLCQILIISILCESQILKMSNKRVKTQQQQLKAYMQEQKRKKSQVLQHKNKMLPYVKFLKNKQLRFSHARVQNSRIQYFRLDDFQKILSEHAEQIQKNEEFSKVSKQVRQQLIYFKRPAHLKGKYPDMLEPVASDDGQRKYASFRFDTTESKRWMMWGIIFTVLSLVLFPIWPYGLKYAIWLISFVLLIFLVSLILIRLLVYLVCVIFGYDVWILPNLMGQQGFVDSFKPLIYHEKWQISLFTILIRLFVISSLVAYGCYLYLNPNVFYENIQLTKQTVSDIHDWGVHKIKNQKNFSQRAITNLEVILNETADIQDSMNTQYKNFSQNTDDSL